VAQDDRIDVDVHHLRLRLWPWATWWTLLAVGSPLPRSRNWLTPLVTISRTARIRAPRFVVSDDARARQIVDELVTEGAVDGEVVLATQQIVVRPRDARLGRVDAWDRLLRRAVVCHRELTFRLN